VKNLQKEYISKMKDLKNEYKWKMWNRSDRNDYLREQRELRNEYKEKLKTITWKNKKTYDYSQNKKKSYRKALDKKYAKQIWNMSDDKLEVLINRIDAALVQINNWNYSGATKEKYTALLEALREMAEDELNNSEQDVFDLDSLFK
jgi:hypothetical protein